MISLKVKAIKNARKIKKTMFAGAVGFGASAPVNVLATGGNQTTSDQVVGEVINVIFKIAKYVAIVWFAWALVQLFMAFRNDDANSKTQSVTQMVAAIALFGISAFATPIIQSMLPGFTPKP